MLSKEQQTRANQLLSEMTALGIDLHKTLYDSRAIDAMEQVSSGLATLVEIVSVDILESWVDA